MYVVKLRQTNSEQTRNKRPKRRFLISNFLACGKTEMKRMKEVGINMPMANAIFPMSETNSYRVTTVIRNTERVQSTNVKTKKEKRRFTMDLGLFRKTKRPMDRFARKAIRRSIRAIPMSILNDDHRCVCSVEAMAVYDYAVQIIASGAIGYAV